MKNLINQLWIGEKYFIQTNDQIISSPKFFQAIAKLNQAKRLNAVRKMYGVPLLNEGRWTTVEQRNQLAVILTQHE